MFDLDWADRLQGGVELAIIGLATSSGLARTCILVVQLQKVALLVQLVGVAVQKSKDGLQLRDGIIADIHEGRLESLYYG